MISKIKTIIIVLTAPIWIPVVILWDAIFDDGTILDSAYEETRKEDDI